MKLPSATTQQGTASRLVGFTLTGVCIGIAAATVREIAKRAWVTVLTGRGEGTRYLIDTVQPYAEVLLEYRPGGLILASYVYGKKLTSQERSGQKSVLARLSDFGAPQREAAL